MTDWQKIANGESLKYNEARQRVEALQQHIKDQALRRQDELAVARLLARIDAATAHANTPLWRIAMDRLHDRLYRWRDR